MKNGRFPKEEFCETQRLNPFWSSWVCFTKIIQGRNTMSNRVINKAFDSLVDKEDYDKSDRKELLQWIYRLTEPTVKTKRG